MFNDNQIKTLELELDSNRIKTRTKGNINLSYLEGFDIIETANRLFGFGNWEYTISKLEMVSQEKNQNDNNVICYKAIVKTVVYDTSHSKQITREDVGFGTGISKGLADAHEGGAKEAVTDSLKRSLKSYGNQMGLSLYDKSKNHTQSQTQNQSQNYNNSSHNQSSVNNTNQTQYQPQKQTNQQHNQTPGNTPHRNQQDYPALLNIGLNVVEQGDNLIVVGDGIFEKKDAIKGCGFRWDGQSRTWYIPLRQVA